MKKLEWTFSVLSGASLVVVFLVTFGQVVQRYVFQMPMPWSTDVIRIFFVYSVFFGMTVGVLRKSHLNIDVLVQALPKRFAPFFRILSNVVMGIFLGFVLWFSIPFIMANTDQYTPYLMFPMSYVYLVVPITAAIMLLSLVKDSIFEVRK